VPPRLGGTFIRFSPSFSSREQELSYFCVPKPPLAYTCYLPVQYYLPQQCAIPQAPEVYYQPPLQGYVYQPPPVGYVYQPPPQMYLVQSPGQMYYYQPPTVRIQ
jgi:hypothetical protein